MNWNLPAVIFGMNIFIALHGVTVCCAESLNQVSGLGDYSLNVLAIGDHGSILNSNIILCNDPSIDLRLVSVGFMCKTSRGAIFQRVKEKEYGAAWMGPDRLIWGDLIGEYYHYDAVAACDGRGEILPSNEDFHRGELSGFREVLPNMSGSRFWSRSYRPNAFELAYFFVASDGSFSYGYRETRLSVRCVRRD